MRASRTAILLLALGLAAPAAAAPRLAIGPIRGGKARGLHGQLAAALCGQAGCARWTDATSQGKPDPARMGKRGVAGALTAAIPAKGKGSLLILALYTRSRKPVQTWSLALTRRGLLEPDVLEQLRHDLAAILGAEAIAAPPHREAPPVAALPQPAAPPPPAPPPAAPAPAPAPPPAAAKPVPLPPPPVARAAPRAPAPARAPPPPPPAARPPYLAGELGLYLTGRKLSYQGAGTGTGTLRAFNASAIASPRLRLELYPAAGSSSRALGGLGLFADYSTSVGQKTQVEGTSEKRGTSFSSLEAGLLWRTPPLGGAVVLVPALSYRRTALAVSPSITGLPDAHLTGLEGSLGAEISLGDRVAFLLGGGYVRWSGRKDLVGPSFFPSGSAHGLVGEGGLAIRAGGGISVRALAEYRSTAYTLDADPTGTYVATGATDKSLGGRLMLRGEY